jgi:hypothetical protein
LKEVLSGLRFSAMQLLSMVLAFFSMFFGIALVSLLVMGMQALGLASLASMLSGVNIMVFIMAATYGVIWYVALWFQYRQGASEGSIVLFGVLPLAALLPYFFYLGFFVRVDPATCGFLFPVMVYGLYKSVFPCGSRRKKVVRTLLLGAGLLIVLCGLLWFSARIIDPIAPPQFLTPSD